LLVGLAEHVVYPLDLDIMAAEVFDQEVDIETCQAVLVLDHHLVNRFLFHQSEQLLELGTGVAHPGANFVIRLDHIVFLLGGVCDEPSHLSVKVAFLFLLMATDTGVQTAADLVVLLDLGLLEIAAELLDVLDLVAAVIPRRLDGHERAVAIPITERFVADAESFCCCADADEFCHWLPVVPFHGTHGASHRRSSGILPR